MNTILKRLFEHDAVELAKQAGMLVCGWWLQPQSGPSALARFAGSVDLTLCKQAVDCHFTERTAQWLLALLRRAVQYLVCAQAVSLPLLQQFTAVLIEDGSTISLPSVLASQWKGCGGRTPTAGKDAKSEAGIKITVRWNLLEGSLQGPHLQEARSHEVTSVLREQQMPKGSLWMADLGYWSLKWLGPLAQQGVYFLMRSKAGAVIWLKQEQVDLLALLPQQQGERAEWRVDLGASQQVKGIRLLAERVADPVATQRQQRIKQYARDHGKPINPLLLEQANWTILVTNGPVCMLSLEQAFALLHARWQVELLFKLWKEHALVDQWTSSKPERILCEVYAKLLAMVIQHWFVLLSCWDDPHHSLPGVAEVLREQVPLLAHGLCKHMPLGRAVRLIVQSVRGGCSIADRRTRPSTSRRLLRALDHPLP